ncbi:DNA cytosine methyltransferase [Rhizobium leguminosarum]|uniref:DNA cytosine methyltransferase n=1 Tax=Rhizobium leguminosarum TaxID=384 RepID=UPI0014424F2B|nr:DNA cytosine methyltransferase [Rhizobium leguminosarum]NKL77649.1 hypothetical protein [Rhizobium leguminosarum bv. viciae]
MDIKAKALSDTRDRILKLQEQVYDFPDEWEFVGGLVSVADQIGNAVEPAVGQAMGLAMMSVLKGEINWRAMLSVANSGRDSPSDPSPLGPKQKVIHHGNVGAAS